MLALQLAMAHAQELGAETFHLRGWFMREAIEHTKSLIVPFLLSDSAL